MGRTVEQAEALAEKLRSLPAVENKKRVISKAEEIKLLANEIAAMQGRGYTIQQVAEILTGNGLDIGAGTLKSYLQRAKGEKRKAVTKKKAPSSTSTQAAEAAPLQSISDRAAAALPKQESSTGNAAAAITRPDREKI